MVHEITDNNLIVHALDFAPRIVDLTPLQSEYIKYTDDNILDGVRVFTIPLAQLGMKSKVNRIRQEIRKNGLGSYNIYDYNSITPNSCTVFRLDFNDYTLLHYFFELNVNEL